MGSGILAIAARMLGLNAVFAGDLDGIACQVAAENFQRNLPWAVPTFCGSIDAVQSGSVDLLLCNLTADQILKVFPDVRRVLSPKGVGIFSGILRTQGQEVFDLCSGYGFTVLEETSRGEWLALVARKDGD
jgi:ribosomal protein L11 methyltransferase